MTNESVWIVDDDSSIRWVLEKALGKADVPVASFDSGNGALEALQKEEPAVIVSDIQGSGYSTRATFVTDAVASPHSIQGLVFEFAQSGTR